MITLFTSFRAPNVPSVDIFRDHGDPNQFYVQPDRPTIATDAKTGSKLFNFTLFSRNIEIAFAGVPEGQPVESQLGSLNMTCDLSVAEDDMTKIRTHLTDLLRREMASPSVYNTLFRVRTTQDKPKLAYADSWIQGSVRLDMLEGLGNTFKRSSSQSTHPTLRGTNSASLWATFGSEGAQLLYRSLKPASSAGGGNQTNTAVLQANITYELEGYARVPGIRVHIHADGKTVYEEFRKRVQVMERVGNTTWTYPQVSSLVKQLSDSRAIQIDWDDWGIPAADPKAEEIKAQLQSTVLNLITGKIVELLFKQFEMKGVQDADLGTTFTHSLGGKPGSRLWLNEFREEFNTNIDFTLNQTQNTKFKIYPQTSLLTAFTPQETESLVRVVDVGSPEVRVLTVPVSTNADFENDRIASIQVSLSYRQFDTLVDAWVETVSEPMIFRTGKETFIFRTRLARDREGRLINFYDAKARINYIATAQTPQPIELKNITDRSLVFSYDRLGYVRVEAQAGDIDWTQIREVFIDFEYEPARGESDARGTVKLTQAQPVARWSSSKHGRSGNRYTYKPRFIFINGREVAGPQLSDERERLVIHDTIQARLRRNFDVAMDQATVDNVLLKVRYDNPPESPAEERKQFTSSGSWEYVRPLEEGTPREIKYAYDVQYKDGELESIPWKPVTQDQDLPAIRAKRHRFLVRMDGTGVDWTKYRTVIVEITYRDAAHGYLKTDEFRVVKEEPLKEMEVFAFSPDARTYSWRATAVPRDGSEPKESEGTRRGILLLESVAQR